MEFCKATREDFGNGIEQIVMASYSWNSARLVLMVNIDTNEVKYEVRNGIEAIGVFSVFTEALDKFNSEV